MYDKNLFAYCDNNPVARVDDGGEFWHIVVGGLVGGVVSAAATIVTNYLSGNPLNMDVGTSFLSGVASGALASTGVTLGGMIAGNIMISTVESISSQLINDGEINVGEVIYDAAIGGTSAAIGGPGKGSKHLTNLGKQSVKRTYNTAVHKGVKQAVNEGKKAVSYYKKNTEQYYKNYKKGIPYDFVGSIMKGLFSEKIWGMIEKQLS